MKNNKIELLTKEDKDFLSYWKFDYVLVTFDEWLLIHSKTIGSGIILDEELKLEFKGLKREQKYSARELDL